MTAPSTYTSNPHDGRAQVDLPDNVEAPFSDPVAYRPSTQFSARYAGKCASCTSKIVPGEAVTYGLDDALEHVECPDELTIPVQGVCDRCYLVLPVSGICGVCE